MSADNRRERRQHERIIISREEFISADDNETTVETRDMSKGSALFKT